MILSRLRAAARAFRQPALVTTNMIAVPLPSLHTGVVRAAIRESVVDEVLRLAIAAIGRQIPRGDDNWWDGYDAAITDARQDLEVLRRDQIDKPACPKAFAVETFPGEIE